MRTLLTNYRNIRAAVNMHAWGPLFITPFNFANKQNKLLHQDFHKAQTFYENVFEHAEPLGYSLGNGAITIGYTANGEASDWMLGERGVYAISPELGTTSHSSETFFIKSEHALKKVLVENYDWLEKLMARFFPLLAISH